MGFVPVGEGLLNELVHSPNWFNTRESQTLLENGILAPERRGSIYMLPRQLGVLVVKNTSLRLK